jgi:hypothetical protein
MTKKSCCCGTANRNCCSSFLYDEFVTLVGATMVTANPVHPDDLIVLKIKRPGLQRNPKMIYGQISTNNVNCGTGCSESGG